MTSRWRSERHVSQNEDVRTGKLPTIYKILWFLCNVNCSLSIIISFVYWITLYRPDRHYLDFENFSGHLLIAVVNVFDIFISNRPWRLIHAFHAILFGGLFGLFSLLYFLVGGTNYYFEPFIYHILDWSHPVRTLLVMGGVSIFLIFSHTGLFLLYQLRLVLISFVKRRRTKSRIESKNEEKCINC